MKRPVLRAGRSHRSSLVDWIALIALGTLAGCTTTRRAAAPSAPAAGQTAPAAAAQPGAAGAPPPADTPAMPAPPAPAPAPVLAPAPPAPVLAPAPPAPAQPAHPAVTAKAATTPCVCNKPVAKPRPKKHRLRPKKAVKQPEPQSVGPAPPPANAVVDAEVGRIDVPLTSILGKDVFSPKGENLGRVVDLLADSEGKVRVAIIDFGGFLGVGTRRIAVDWPLLHFTPEDKDKSLRLTVTREKLQSAPVYKDSASPRVLVPPAATRDAAGADSKK